MEQQEAQTIPNNENIKETIADHNETREKESGELKPSSSNVNSKTTTWADQVEK